MKIRAKLLLPIYSCILLSFFIIGASIFFIVYQNNLQNGFDHLETRTQLEENKVNNFLSELTEKLLELSESSDTRESIKVLSKFQGNKNSQTYQDTLKDLENRLEHFQSLYPEIQEILFTDVFGIIVYSMNSQQEKGKFIEENYGKGFLKRSQASLFISDIRLKDINNPDSSYIFASNTVKENNGTIGSIIIELSTQKLDIILSENSGFGETGETYLVDREGIIKTRRENFTFTKFSTQINSPSFHGCFDDDISFIQSNSYENMIGENVIGRYKYIPDIDMCLIAEIHLDEVLSTAKRVLVIIMMASLFVFLGVSGLIHIFVKNITSPLLYLTEKIKEVGKGNKTISLKVESDDEIGDLTQSFQHMLQQLSITDERIQNKVEEQTKEIKQKQKEAEKLNKDLFKFQAALKEASDYIAILDPKGRIVYINTSLEKETGYTLQECLGKHPYDFRRREETKEKAKNIWKQVAETKSSIVADLFTTRKDGTNFISEVHISPILNTAGKIVFYLTIENDITQETAVRKMKDDFISLVSHELRTPMTVIKGFSKILLDEKSGDLNANQKKYLGRIHSNVNYLISMVNDMLDIEKLNSGKMNFQYQDFDIFTLLDDIKDELSPMCKEKNIILTLTGKKSIIHSDHEKIKQVMINLIRNAYKFTPENGDIHIVLSKKKHIIKIEVIDTGIGIKQEDFSKIFQKFGQVDSPLQRQHEGTGLGLSICQLIVEKLGGEIGFSSTYEQGSNFYFTITRP